ncbi:unnamed protein product [Chrysodeixis includens]|uniref:Uncharacterized protein n=1 Tax=Chrysodeixis includens TaxID=689277 RepID=A0A9N8KP82_CHRIL|nr:unnamed protein product [Chrysodeixis includens]
MSVRLLTQLLDFKNKYKKYRYYSQFRFNIYLYKLIKLLDKHILLRNIPASVCLLTHLLEVKEKKNGWYFSRFRFHINKLIKLYLIVNSKARNAKPGLITSINIKGR